MTGVILVVDDVPANVKLLEAKLTAEYYDVVTAKDGYEAIEQAHRHKPDLILLDVMMPGMDGFTTCKHIKADADIAHTPVVMVTALSDISDRVQGLEAGADDFITKPINDTALMARVKSLIRIKVLIDELRLRDQSGAQMGVISDIVQSGMDVSNANIIIIDDDAVQSRQLRDVLEKEHQVQVFKEPPQGLEAAKNAPPDLIFISTMLMSADGLRLATQFKAVEGLRHVPIITLIDEDQPNLMLKSLELGVNDYLVTPVDNSEMAARVRTQLRRKKYQDALKSNYKENVSMAITDALTGLYNRHYLDTHMKNLVESSLQNGKNMSVVIMDMDHFKHVNDTYGHDVGDEVLVQLAKRIVDATRSSDLVARFGGEEFVILMPETDFKAAFETSERIRASIERTPFKISHEIGELSKTTSVGLASINHHGDTPEAILKRADTALYQAKHNGRNQVQPRQNPFEFAAQPAGAPPATAAPAAPQNSSPAAPQHPPVAGFVPPTAPPPSLDAARAAPSTPFAQSPPAQPQPQHSPAPMPPMSPPPAQPQPQHSPAPMSPMSPPPAQPQPQHSPTPMPPMSPPPAQPQPQHSPTPMPPMSPPPAQPQPQHSPAPMSPMSPPPAQPQQQHSPAPMPPMSPMSPPPAPRLSGLVPPLSPAGAPDNQPPAPPMPQPIAPSPEPQSYSNMSPAASGGHNPSGESVSGMTKSGGGVGSRMPSAPGFDPAMAERQFKPAAVPSSTTEALKKSMLELKTPPKSDGGGPANKRDSSYKSPIDDEPPGTF